MTASSSSDRTIIDLPTIERDAPTAGQGVLYCATGPKTASLFHVIFSAASLREHYDGPITLVTDLPDSSTGEPCAALDIDVRRVSLDCDGPYRSRYLKTQLAQLTPYDRTLFLDADTLIMRPIDELFTYDLALALDARQTIGDSVEFLTAGNIDGAISDELQATLSHCDADFPHYNSGVIAWRTCEENDQLFSAWHHQWRQFGTRDQAALARALRTTKTPTTTLSKENNYFGEYGSPNSNPSIVVWHACGPMGRIHRRYPQLHSQAAQLVQGVFECRTDMFPLTAVPTEAMSRELLASDPIAHVNYAAVPWCELLKAKNVRAAKAIHVDGGFTICQHIDYQDIIPYCQEIGVDTIFTPHADGVGKPSWRDRLRQGLRRLTAWRRGNHSPAKPIRVLPFPHVAVNGIEPADRKDLLYSFIGCRTHASRDAIFDMPTRGDAFVECREQWHFYGDEADRERDKRQYQEVLARSRYSLCPRGTGPSTIRFWESLQAGAIPVLFADAMQLPAGFDWDRCVIRIAESDVASSVVQIEQISSQQEAAMRAACLEAYEVFSGENLVRCIRETYATDAEESPSLCRNAA